MSRRQPKSFFIAFVVVVAALAAPHGAARAQPAQATPGAAPAASTEVDPVRRLRGRSIERIEVRLPTGFDRATVLQEGGLRVGQTLTSTLVRGAIEKIYAKGNLSDVVVSARAEGKGVVLLLTLVPQVRLHAVKFRGNSAASEDELRKDFNFQVDQEYSPDLLEKLEVSIAATYKRKGYYKVAAELEVKEETGTGLVRVEAEIREGTPTRVRAIRFDGEHGASRQVLLRELKLFEGDILDRERLRNGVENLKTFFRKKGFYEVQIAEPDVQVAQNSNDATVRFALAPGPLVVVRFVDARGFRRSDLITALKLDDERRIDFATMPVLRERLQRLFQEMGFLRVGVVSKFDSRRKSHPDRKDPGATGSSVPPTAGPDARKTLTFRILPGPRVRVVDLSFPGAKAVSVGRLREVVLSLVEERVSRAGLFERVFPEQVHKEFGAGSPRRGLTAEGYSSRPLRPRLVYLERAYKDATEDIAQLFKARGYAQVVVDEPRVIEIPKTATVRVEIAVQEGPKSTIRSVAFAGQRVLTVSELRGLIALKAGQPYNPTIIEEARRKLQKRYEQLGYAFAKVLDNETFSEPSKEDVDVVFQITEGDRVYIGKIDIEGNERTNPAVIKDVLTIKTGDIYNTDKILESQQNLFNLGLFSTASIDPVNRLPERFKNLRLSMRERKPGSVEAGGGFSIGDGPRSFLNVAYNNIFGYNLRALFFLKVNYQLFLFADQATRSQRSAELDWHQLLERQATFSLQYPKILGIPFPLGARFDVTHQGRSQLAFSLQKFAALATLEFKFSTRFNVQLQYEFENSFLQTPRALAAFVNDVKTSPFLDGAQRLLLLRTTVGALNFGSTRAIFSLDLRDNPFNPRKGFIGTLLSEHSASLFNAKVNYLKLQGTLTGHIPLGARSQLALQASGGGIYHLSRTSQTPAHRSLFLGGRSSIRGYTEESIIAEGRPVTASDINSLLLSGLAPISTGGEVFFFAKTELRFPLAGKLEGAIFCDLGNLWLNLDAFDFWRMPRLATGIGVRYPTPVGPLSFDIAFPITRRYVLAEDPISGKLQNVNYEPFFGLHFSIGVF